MNSAEFMAALQGQSGEPGCSCHSSPVLHRQHFQKQEICPRHGVLLASLCHPGAPVHVRYFTEGILDLTCGVCGRALIRVAVAEAAE